MDRSIDIWRNVPVNMPIHMPCKVEYSTKHKEMNTNIAAADQTALWLILKQILIFN
jgi:hypothetical protein